MMNKHLICYAFDPATKQWQEKWTSDNPFNPLTTGNTFYPSLIIADINNDGHAEILAVDKIYDAETGTELATLPEGGRGYSTGGMDTYMPVFADMVGDPRLEIVAGNTVYEVNLTNRNGTAGNTVTKIVEMNAIDFPDGFTSIADIDNNGDLDIVVTTGGSAANTAMIYAWDGATPTQIGQTITVTSNSNHISRATIGDINGDKEAEIAFTYCDTIMAMSYEIGIFNQLFKLKMNDASGATSMVMFDFNQDGEVELVHRDAEKLRIYDKNGNILNSFDCLSDTHTEYPVIVDLDRDGHAEILVSGKTDGYNDVHIIRYGAKNGQWAPARNVWNQHSYCAVNIKNNLTIPKFRIRQTVVFAGADGKFGTADDVRPYNNFLQQQTLLNMDGVPVWLTPDAIFDESKSNASDTGDSITINVCITNQGAAAMSGPVYVTVYKDDISSANILKIDSLNGYIYSYSTGCLTIGISSIKNIPIVRLIVRLNDNGTVYPVQPECDYGNSLTFIFNPAIKRMMKKDATLNGIQCNGAYPNPVSVLHKENIKYDITAVNANLTSGKVVISDTLPPYLKYVPGTSSKASKTTTSETPSCDVLTWTFSSVASFDTVYVVYEATPESGACASQPFYINKAIIQVSDTLFVSTNRTYHQGAGVSVVSFSSSFGGNIYNADEQALDYKTSPRNNILVVPDEGYRFAGWRHDEYISLRGEVIRAASGIMHCDSLTIYGNVELHAVFELDDATDQPNIDNSVDKPEELPEEKIWSAENTLYIKTNKPGSIVKIYRTDVALQEQHTITTEGTTPIKLPQGIYVVTFNDGTGQKVFINRE
jgi:hypothetical protein